MTTIATDGRTIAADGLRKWGDIRVGLTHQKIRVAAGRIIGFAGSAPLFDTVVKWIVEGAEPSNVPKNGDSDWTALVIDSGGIRKISSGSPYFEFFDPPVAIGAGCDYAMGAMWVGATPAMAIREIAARTDHTGGEISEIDIADALAECSVPQAAE